MIAGRDWVFVRNPKCATTSIDAALGEVELHTRKGTAHGSLTNCGRDAQTKKVRAVSVRNPYDRMVSAYNHLAYKSQSFHGWLTGEPHNVAPGIDLKRTSQFYWTYGTNFIIRFEHIEGDFAEFCRRIGESLILPEMNARPHADYRSYYDRETRRIVADRFAYDIDKFGYEF